MCIGGWRRESRRLGPEPYPVLSEAPYGRNWALLYCHQAGMRTSHKMSSPMHLSARHGMTGGSCRLWRSSPQTRPGRAGPANAAVSERYAVPDGSGECRVWDFDIRRGFAVMLEDRPLRPLVIHGSRILFSAAGEAGRGLYLFVHDDCVWRRLSRLLRYRLPALRRQVSDGGRPV